MSTVKAFIRNKAVRNTKNYVHLRLTDGRNIHVIYRTDLQIEADLWDPVTGHIKKRAICRENVRKTFNAMVDRYIEVFQSIYDQNKGRVHFSQATVDVLMKEHLSRPSMPQSSPYYMMQPGMPQPAPYYMVQPGMSAMPLPAPAHSDHNTYLINEMGQLNEPVQPSPAHVTAPAPQGTVLPATPPAKRKRGRPRKVQPAPAVPVSPAPPVTVEQQAFTADQPETVPQKRKRGRPRKIQPVPSVAAESPAAAPQKRKRGRPRKPRQEPAVVVTPAVEAGGIYVPQQVHSVQTPPPVSAIPAWPSTSYMPIDAQVAAQVYTDPNVDYSIFTLLKQFLAYKDYERDHEKTYNILYNLFRRFETYEKIIHSESFTFDIRLLNYDLLMELRDFILNEYKLYDIRRFKRIWADDQLRGQKRRPVQRGHNALIRYLKRLRTLVRWCIKQDILTKDPFLKFEIGSCHNGKPYYINIEERDAIAKADIKGLWEALTEHEKYAISHHVSPNTAERLTFHRDLFIFQCLVGCRRGDLYRFKPTNISGDILSYVPHKTKDNSNSLPVSVPLSPTAKKIAYRYMNPAFPDKPLFPLHPEQTYNEDIKTVFRLCKITRSVPVLNTKTSEYEQKRLCDVASSHMARRTFIGNLYKKVKDPELIGKLSGHAEGSKAFTRYRDIDMDVKREVIDLLEDNG